MRRPQWTTISLWVFSIALLNSVWFIIATQTVPYEVNSPQQTEQYREVEVAAFGLLNEPVPSTFDVDFSSEIVDDGNVSYRILYDNVTLIHQWSGFLAQPTVGWEGTLEPGTYTVVTTTDQGIVVDQTFTFSPLKPYHFAGHIIATCLLIITAFLEQWIRRFVLSVTRVHPHNKTEHAPFTTSPIGMPEADAAYDEQSPWRPPQRPS